MARLGGGARLARSDLRPTSPHRPRGRQVERAGDRIALRLLAKPGMTLYTAGIEACLDYTVGRGEG